MAGHGERSFSRWICERVRKENSKAKRKRTFLLASVNVVRDRVGWRLLEGGLHAVIAFGSHGLVGSETSRAEFVELTLMVVIRKKRKTALGDSAGSFCTVFVS